MGGSIVPEYVDDISILLIDHDTASVTSLTSMLKQFSKRVMSVDVASKALSMIEKQKKDIGLIIANIETPHIDSHSFLTALFHKDIPLILINSEIKTKKPSDLLTKRACFSLDKPISENDIKNMWQHMLPKKTQELKKINITENQETANQIEAFRASLKRQRTSQASLLRRRPIFNTFTTSETYQKRKSIANVEWTTKPGCPIENKKNEWKKVNSNVRRRKRLWPIDRHMKFLAAISILGEKEFRPTSILRIINDPNLTDRQVASHLQKYKAQIERISDTLPRNEWKSTDRTFEYPSDYEYPFTVSNLTKNLIACNSLWNSLRKKNSSSSSFTQFIFEKPIIERKKNMPKLHLGGKLDLRSHSLFGNVLNKSSIDVNYVPSTKNNNPPYNILSTDNANHTSLVSTGLGSENLPIISGLPSNVGASNTWAFPMESTRISIPQCDPSPFRPPKSVLETDVNQIDLDFTSIPNYTLNPFETNIDERGWVPSTENHNHHKINMNHIDWVPSTTNCVLPETDMNINFPEKNTSHMDWVSSGEGYVPSENMIPSKVDINQMDMGYSGGNIPQEDTNTNQMSFVSSDIRNEIPPKTNMTILETNYLNPVDCFVPKESYVLPENITSTETNTIQKGLVSCETSNVALDNMVPFETNTEKMNYVPYDEGFDVPIEDLISFDIDVIDKDMPSWLEDIVFSERNNPSSPSYLDHDPAFRKMDSTTHITVEGHDQSVAINLGRQANNVMESRNDIEAINQKDDMEGRDNFLLLS